MADLTYFMLAPMEHNGGVDGRLPGPVRDPCWPRGDDEADYQTMREHAHAEGIEGTVFIGKWCSGFQWRRAARGWQGQIPSP